ncbi:MAG TPA: hypothetical protein VH595_01305 [Verrucomicrobiae bacterium]|jgi:hypothetical protein|nr:hypothetical protein [Verrucomicrobiae bacterium]
MKRKLWMVCALLVAAIQMRAVAAEDAGLANWVNISDPVIAAVTNAGTKIPWPGGTAGVAVDRTTGAVYMDLPNLGLWKSTDHGANFVRVAEGAVSGRSVSGYSMNCDPASSRMACLLLEGKSGMTLDGTHWQSFASVGRNWEYGAVDWSDPQARAIFADRHESDGEKYVSSDAGVSWKLLGKHPDWSSLGIFDARTLVVGKENGIARSTDGGETWTKISDLHPVGRVAVYFNGLTYWLAKEGLITNTDKGATWQVMGTPVDAEWGPLFGKDEKHIVVANYHSFLKTTNGGKTWETIAPMIGFAGKWVPKLPGQYLNIGWDPNANILYASQLGCPTYRLQLTAP